MDKVFYNSEPEQISYMQLSTGSADVWLRQDIEQATDEETGEAQWTANEVYFRTTLSLEEVKEGFDALFKNEGPVIDEVTGEESVDDPTTEERLDALEEAVLELAALVLEG